MNKEEYTLSKIELTILENKKEMTKLDKILLDTQQSYSLLKKQNEHLQNQKLYKKINEITKKEKVNKEDLEYIIKCSNKINLLYLTKHCDTDIENIQVYISNFQNKDYLEMSYLEEGPMYEIDWGDTTSDTLACFNCSFEITEDLEITYHTKDFYNNSFNSSINLIVENSEEEKLALIFNLDESKM